MAKQYCTTAVSVLTPVLLLLALHSSAVFPEESAADAPEIRHINDNFNHPNVEVWVERFEGEGREVYDYRHELVEAIGLQPGQVVADVGAGTGLFEPLLAHKVGADGLVYAEDIAQEFIDHIQKKAAEAGLSNIHTVLGDEHSVRLPENSTDVVYICDAYHHFVYYKDMLRSIHSALKPGGQLFLVEFDKESGASNNFLKNHIRATKEQFTAEIEAGGFQLSDDVRVEGLRDTFVRRFIKR